MIADHNGGLVVLRNGSGPSPAGEQLWVRDVAPTDFATGVAVTKAPRVSFQRALDPASVNDATLRLVNGRTGATVPTTLVYDAATKTVTLRPTASLQGNTPYRIVVGAVRDEAGATYGDGFSMTFQTSTSELRRSSSTRWSGQVVPRR